jgi:hypothetical protein
MEWLKAIAPTVVTALGGPLAGMALAAVSKTLNIAPEEVQDVLNSNKLTAEQVASIQLAELELKKQAQSMNIDFEQLAVADRKSARDMQVATKSYLVPLLAVIIVTSFVGVVVSTLAGFSTIDSVMAGTLIGYLSAKADQVLSFFFGSTAGSQRKTELLSKAEAIK